MVDRATMVKIAYWYYKKNITQEEIAKRLGYSRQRVNKLVSSLIPEGIVNIEIRGLEHEHIMLENELEHHFSLKRVIIADTKQAEMPRLAVLGKKAADFLDEYIQDGKTVGVSWGSTLGETISYMHATNKKRCSVVQLVGGLEAADMAVKPDEITRMLAAKLGCDYNILYAPAVLSDEVAREILAEQQFYKEAAARIEHCDIAVIGIGQLHENATIVSSGYLPEADMRDMLAKGYVGDICFNHYRADGDTGIFQVKKRVMGVDIETLRRIPVVIAIAGGEDKAESVLGALNTGCLDVLIVDIALAAKLEAMTLKRV
ncbi:sugar-binding transcriptional regulator [Eubacteriales bacterium OttesenSCG-928-K08]|nr:sugar-binding transcriptional regulator [Eubacteriales bacterium OttesenSCG-928-K08]